MSDEEYKEFLSALAAEHLSRAMHPEELDRLRGTLNNLTRVSRRIQDLREEAVGKWEPVGKRKKDDSASTNDLVYELKETRVSDGFYAMERVGILEALDEATDAVFANLRRSAIPDEDVQFLYRAGIANPELEIKIIIEYAKKRISSSPESVTRKIRMTGDIHHEMADQLERASKELAQAREMPQPRKRKLLNGIGKILGGAIAGTGNVLLLFGTIIAPNPATGYGAIASSALAVAGVLQGAGDLRGE